MEGTEKRPGKRLEMGDEDLVGVVIYINMCKSIILSFGVNFFPSYSVIVVPLGGVELQEWGGKAGFE